MLNDIAAGFPHCRPNFIQILNFSAKVEYVFVDKELVIKIREDTSAGI